MANKDVPSDKEVSDFLQELGEFTFIPRDDLRLRKVACAYLTQARRDAKFWEKYGVPEAPENDPDSRIAMELTDASPDLLMLFEQSIVIKNRLKAGDNGSEHLLEYFGPEVFKSKPLQELLSEFGPYIGERAKSETDLWRHYRYGGDRGPWSGERIGALRARAEVAVAEKKLPALQLGSPFGITAWDLLNWLDDDNYLMDELLCVILKVIPIRNLVNTNSSFPTLWRPFTSEALEGGHEAAHPKTRQAMPAEWVGRQVGDTPWDMEKAVAENKSDDLSVHFTKTELAKKLAAAKEMKLNTAQQRVSRAIASGDLPGGSIPLTTALVWLEEQPEAKSRIRDESNFDGTLRYDGE